MYTLVAMGSELLGTARPRTAVCAGWARNPNQPQVISFPTKLAANATIWDIGTGVLRRISVRRSVKGSTAQYQFLCLTM